MLHEALPQLELSVAADLVRKHYYLGKKIFDGGDIEPVKPTHEAPTWSPEEIAELRVIDPQGAAKISSLSLDDVANQAVSTRGNMELGRYMFTKANCVACHTVSEERGAERTLPGQHRQNV